MENTKNPVVVESEASLTVGTGWSRAQKIMLVVILIGALGIGSVGTYFMVRGSSAASGSNTEPGQLASVIDEIGKIMVLPTDEQPTLATVSDPNILRGQAFFANAQKGFKVVVYSKAGKAILYDPFQKKIVEVAPVNLGNIGK